MVIMCSSRPFFAYKLKFVNNLITFSHMNDVAISKKKNSLNCVPNKKLPTAKILHAIYSTKYI